MGIVHQQTELEILLRANDHVEEAQIALHAEHTLGNDQHAALLLLGQLRSMTQLQTQRLLVVVGIGKALAVVHAQTVDDAGVALLVVDHHVARREQAVDDRDHALIAEVQQESILLADELGQLALQLLVILGLTRHHAGTHRRSHAILGACLGVGLTHLGMIGQSEIVVKAPIQNLLAAENHVRTDLALQFRECEISVHARHILSDRTAGIFR